MGNIQIEVDSSKVALLTIDLKDRSMNVFTPELLADLDAAVDAVTTDPAIKGAVITSGKANGFIAGADLKELVTAFDSGMTTRNAYAWSEKGKRVFRRIETSGKPFAAAINGVALGGGLELCLACHYRVLEDSARTAVGLPEVTLGLLPAGGGTQRLPRMIGIEKALPLLLEGKRVPAREALELGIVDAIAPAKELVELARRWVSKAAEAVQPWDRKGFVVPGGAGTLARHANQSFSVGTAQIAKTKGRNYPAPLAILSSVFEGTQVPIDTGLRIESKYFARLLVNPVARNLIRTLFVHKGLADKLICRPREIPSSRVRNLGVLGAGMMGAGIAFAAASAGIEVVLLDADAELAQKGKAYSERLLGKDVERGRVTAVDAERILGRIRPTVSYAALRECDFVVEAVFEDREVKRDVTRKAIEHLPPTAVFASNTSTLPITGLAETSDRPKLFLGVHFFSPVERMPLVEIIVGTKTGEEALARALDFVGQLGKTPIVVKDSPGFYTSRIFISFIDEGMAMLREGIEPALIENAAKMAGMPVGPLAIADEVTLDLQWRAVKQAEADGLDKRFLRRHAYEVIEQMTQRQHRLGRRFGRGFYEYPKDGRKFLWPELKRIFPLSGQQPEEGEVKSRLLYIQALEAARCQEEGVLTRPEDADLGSILGVGFPSYTGGTISFIDTVGIGKFVEECGRLARAYGSRFEPSPWLLDRAKRGQPFHPVIAEGRCHGTA